MKQLSKKSDVKEINLVADKGVGRREGGNLTFLVTYP